mmetsp:Transcript_28068/g.41764  ORF Transcript_28068/g.41764 Transcript_28068/m.41764 type:complete len:86 (+) Transcript_28068:690-947(+)
MLKTYIPCLGKFGLFMSRLDANMHHDFIDAETAMKYGIRHSSTEEASKYSTYFYACVTYEFRDRTSFGACIRDKACGALGAAGEQ